MTATERVETQLNPPQPQVLTVASCRILRSPSHESVTTDLSLFSVSSSDSNLHHGSKRLLSVGRCESSSSDQTLPRGGGHSPTPEIRHSIRQPDIPEILWFEEETELIRSCGALSSSVGLQKSFSTSDITQLPSPEDGHRTHSRNAVSELALNSLQRSGYLLENARLDYTSRSCSTWVAVGDIASTSQLPSPHGGHSNANNAQSTTTTTISSPPAFTAADFIRSVNKKVRQNYIKRRLLTTYKAIERLSQSEFNLDRLEVAPSTAAASISSSDCTHTQCQSIHVPLQISTNAGGSSSRLSVPGGGGGGGAATASPMFKPPTPTNSADAAMLRIAKQKARKNLPLTIRDVEREQGKPLSKYERNMMVFNWLHTLDDSAAHISE